MSAGDSSFAINSVRVSKYAERRAEFTSTVSKDVVAHHHEGDRWSWVGGEGKGRFKDKGERIKEVEEGEKEDGMAEEEWTQDAQGIIKKAIR